MRRTTIPALVATAAIGLTACSGSDDASSDGSSAETTTSAGSSDTTGETDESQSSSDTRDVVDSPPTEDMHAALDATRDSLPGAVSKIELESAETGGLAYKIELVSEDMEYSAQFDADTLDQLGEDRDELDPDDAAEAQKQTFDINDLIDLDEAVGTARDEQDGAVTSWKIEGKDDGSVQYEFDILPDDATDDVEVQIDAEDGSVIHDS